MRAMAGRVGIGLVLSVALAALVAVVCRSSAGAWSDAAAARQAVQTVLAAVRGSASFEFPEFPGEPAKPEDARAIKAELRAFLEALRQGDHDGAWAMVAQDTHGAWQSFAWKEHRSSLKMAPPKDGAPGDRNRRRGVSLRRFIVGRNTRLGEVVTWGGEGACRVIVDDVLPAAVALVRTPAGWRIDLQGTDAAQARLAATRELRAVSPGRGPTDLFEDALMLDGDGLFLNYLDCLALPPDRLDYEVTACTVIGDRAVVSLLGRVPFELEVALDCGDEGWTIGERSSAYLLAPGEKLHTPSPDELKAQNWREQCRQNLQRLSLAMECYCQDYDERLPIADRWTGGLSPYLGPGSAVFHCPGDGEFPYSYAMNYKLSRQARVALPAPQYTVLLFESNLHRADAYDKGGYPGDSDARPPRHGVVNHYVFADGRVSDIEPDRVSRNRFRLNPQPLPRSAGGPGGPPGGPPYPAYGPPGAFYGDE